MVKKLFVHESIVAARMGGGQAHVLVQVEGGSLRIIHRLLAVEPDHFLIGTDWGGTGGQADDAVRLAGDLGSKQKRRSLGKRLGR